MSNGVRLTVLLLATALLVAACAGGGDEAEVDPATGVAAAGEAVYAANCAACHGAELEGAAAGPPLLDPRYGPDELSDEAVVTAIREGAQPRLFDLGAMPPLRDLEPQEIADVIAYMRQQQAAAGIG